MAARHIIHKDLIILMRDRRALTILVVMPLVIIAILGYSTGKLLGWQNENTTLRLVVVDQSGDELGAAIIASLREGGGVDVITTDGPATAYAQVDDGDRTAAVTIGPAFRQRVDALTLGDVLDPSGGALAAGLESIDVHVYARPTQIAAAQIVQQLVIRASSPVLRPHIARRHPVARMLLNPRSVKDKATQAATQPASAPVPRASLQRGSMVYQFIVPSYTVLFAFFLINIMARSFLSERQEGTLLRLQAAPIGTAALLVGKTTPFFLVSVVQGVLLFVFGKLLFGMSWGELPWLLPLAIACTSLAATGLGLVTAVLVRTDAQVSAYANLVVIALAGMSGCFMPREWLPETMRQLSLAIPHAWALIAYDQILNSPHPNVTRILTSCAVLVAFAAALFAFGWHRFRRRVAA